MSNMRNALIQSALQNKNFSYISAYVKKMNQRDIIINECCVDNVRMYTDDNDCIHIMCPVSGMSTIQETSLTDAIVKGTIFDDAEEINNTANYIGSTVLPMNAIDNSGLERPKKLRIGVSAAIGKMDDAGNFKPTDTDINNGIQLVHDIMHNEDTGSKPIDIVDNYIGNDEHKPLCCQMDKDMHDLGDEIDNIKDVDPEKTLNDSDYKELSLDDEDDDFDYNEEEENYKQDDDYESEDEDDEDDIIEDEDSNDDSDDDTPETIEEEDSPINDMNNDDDMTDDEISSDDNSEISSDDNIEDATDDDIDTEHLSPIDLMDVDYDTIDDETEDVDDDTIDEDMYNDDVLQESVFVTKNNVSKKLSISLSNILNRISTFVINDSSTIRKLNRSIVKSYKYINDLIKLNKIPSSNDENKREKQMASFYSEEELKPLIELQQQLKIFSTCLNLKKSWIKTNGDKSTILNENPSPEYKQVYQNLEKSLSEKLKPMVEKAREIVNSKLPQDQAATSSSNDESIEEAYSYDIDNANLATINEYNSIIGLIDKYKEIDKQKSEHKKDNVVKLESYEEDEYYDDDIYEEGFLSKKPKKLKPIPVRELVAYITVEMNAIKDSNDQAMIAGYTCSKLELIDFYISCIDANDARYIVPHSRQYLIDGQTQLNNLLTQILRVRPINKADRIWAVNYPSRI